MSLCKPQPSQPFSVFLRADPVPLPELPVEVACIVIPHGPDNIRNGQPAAGEQVDRLVHPFCLEKLLIGLPGAFPDLPAQPGFKHF